KNRKKLVKIMSKRMTKGDLLHYVAGKHDIMLRKFMGFKLGSFSIANKVVLEINGSKAWMFHGDVFDVTMQHSKWIARLGATGYDMLILLNSVINYCSKKIGRGPVSMSKKIKNSVKSAVKFINDFERIAADIAIENEYDYVVCGHIHQPEIKKVETPEGSVMYLNSGDWVENLTALEYYDNAWHLYSFKDNLMVDDTHTDEDDED